MDSPEEKKGQRRGSCGHVMAAFDLHKNARAVAIRALGMTLVLKTNNVVCAIPSLMNKGS